MSNLLWHASSVEQVLDALGTSINGISSEEAAKRLRTHGLNKLTEKRPVAALAIFLRQFKSPLVYILLIAALISAILNDYVDMVVILFAVILNTLLGFYQEFKADRAIAFLRALIDYRARVLRDGHEIEISSSQVVSGDVLLLHPGDKVAADARLFEIDELQIIEASLTGESMPSGKTVRILERGAGLAERENMVYSGTVVAGGSGKAVVCATGMQTEIGKITQLIKEIKEEPTPLQQNLARFSHHLTWIVVGVAILIMIIGVLEGRPLLGYGHAAREGMLNTAVAVAVAAIPEGLLIAVTAILAIGMQAIVRKDGLVRKLIAAETLGSASVICTDKTGTLTEGKMQVARIITANEDLAPGKTKFGQSERLSDQSLILKISVLCNDAIIENPDEGLENWKILGSPTESALLLAALHSGTDKRTLERSQARLASVSFNSDKKYMLTLHHLNERQQVVYAKGAPERILQHCTQYRTNGEKKTLTDKQRATLTAQYERLTSQGYRVLGFCYKQIAAAAQLPQLANEMDEMIFLGFVALKDPLRREARETLELAARAGIRTVIVTGDHRLTAQAIVTELGMSVENNQIIEGEELNSMSDAELDKQIASVVIFARVEPRHKLRIIQAWQRRGEVVAMTGDGVNDAPALKAADIGIAVGSGTDVAKETSDMILLDDNFKTIIAAIERGRVIFDNIKKVVLYLLTDSFSEVILISGSLLLGLPLPLLPAQILWINIITDGFPGLALTVEPGEREVMSERPRKKHQSILDGEMKTLIFIVGVVTDFVLLGLFIWFLKFSEFSLEHVRTFIFVALGVDSLLYVFSLRSVRKSIINFSFFSNRALLLAVAIGFGWQLVAVYAPVMQRLLETVPLTAGDWLFILALSVLKMAVIELVKHHYIVARQQNASVPA